MKLSTKSLIVCCLLTLAPVAALLASTESYVQTLSGKIKKGDSCVVYDDKFLNMPLAEWNQVRHLSVENIITFELRRDTSFYYQARPFTCTLNVSIKYFTSRDQTSPNEINNIDLVVKYDTGTGKVYPLSASYTKLKNAFKVTVVINSITSAEWGKDLPPVFRLTNQILVERKYPATGDQVPVIMGGGTAGAGINNFPIAAAGPSRPFDKPAAFSFYTPNVAPPAAINANNQFTMSWGAVSGAEAYDLEWTFIDILSDRGQAIKNSTAWFDGSQLLVIPDNIETGWMNNDNTRVTVQGLSYTIDLPYTEGFILYRVRKVVYEADNMRHEYDWGYLDANSHTAGVYIPQDHQPHLNWQYTGSFAEEGKRKEVISYFDGTLRSRQAVTITNNSTDYTDPHNTAVVAETIYDKMGRPTMNVLPAPVTGTELKYYLSINKNGAGATYGRDDIGLLTNSADPSDPTNQVCNILAAPMSTQSGASQYYSPNNPFLPNTLDYFYAKYIPDAGGYPFSVTEYTPDNTGRIRRQGGVGEKFQVGKRDINNIVHDTRYYYGKPNGPRDLERLFGMEVGDVSHYEKNLVVDPNGQASVSYIDANGKTIATALAGFSPPTLDALSSNGSQANTTFTQALIQPTDFTIDAGGLYKSSSTTFTAAYAGSYTLHYSISPATAVPPSPHNGSSFCSNCYYDVSISVVDNCGIPVGTPVVATPPFQGSDIACHDNPQAYTGDMPLNIRNIGEYTVIYTLKLSEAEINYQTDYYLTNNTSLYTIQHFFENELTKVDLSGCYNECSTCLAKLGSLPDFTSRMQQLLSDQKAEKYPNLPENIFDPNSAFITGWITATYNNLLANCVSLQPGCSSGSPCEQKKAMMKSDVMAGGQYAMYDDAALQANATQVFTDRTINVALLHYHDLPEYFTADDGSQAHTVDDAGTLASSLSEADFIRAYQNHSEWADWFVQFHIEYCSYSYCKLSDVEPSYAFDQDLRQVYTTADKAISNGFFDHSNNLALLTHDPFFANGAQGYSYLSQMTSDLQTYTAAILKIVMKDPAGNVLPDKNIISYVDWALYCKPASPTTATQQDWADSWQSCTVNPSCRSVNLEWTMYRDAYLLLKSKYVRLAKQAYNLAHNTVCVDCFIGKDALVDNSCLLPGNLSDYSIVTGVDGGTPTAYVQYKNGTVPFLENYIIQYQATKNGVATTGTVTATQAAMTVKIPFEAPDNIAPAFILTAISCPSTANTTLINCNSGEQEPCPTSQDFHYANDGYQITNYTDGFYESWNIYYVKNSGPVSKTIKIKVRQTVSNFYTGDIFYSDFWVNLDAGQDRVKIGTHEDEWYDTNGDHQASIGDEHMIYDYSVVPDSIVCPVVVSIPSTCTSDPRYPFYLGKIRVFNEYIDQTCLNSQGPAYSDYDNTGYSAASLKAMRDQANAQVDAIKASWLSRLQAVRDEEFSGNTALSDVILTPFVDKLANIAKKYIGIAPVENIRPASTLPPGIYSVDGYNSFEDAFVATFGASLVAQGFSHHLLDKPYPYDRTNFNIDPIVTEVGSDICSNLQNFYNRWTASGSQPTFAKYLQQELGDDYNLTDAQLLDLQNKCSASCTHRYLNDAVSLPVALATSANPDHPGLSCARMAVLQADFATRYPTVTADDKPALRHLLFTNYVNLTTGYSLSYGEYLDFINGPCSAGGTTALLYDKPASPQGTPDDFLCAAGIIKGVFTAAGMEYEQYVEVIRRQFRNSYVSSCLASQASASMTSEQREYHYTLYYYDQSGNLVKTIPPEGVRFLTDEEIDRVEQFKNDDPSGCSAFPSSVLTDKTAILNQLSTALQESNTALSMEMWLFSNSGGPTRQLRMITPDKKYMYQAAIANNKIWVELYTIETGPGGTDDISINLTNQATANLPASMILQGWTHLMVQSPNGLAGGDLQLYVDGYKLTTIPYGSAPPYPYDWEISGAQTTEMPIEDLSIVRHLRVYNSVATDDQVLANYRNSCLGPVGSLAGAPLNFWGRFDIPSFCNNTNIAAAQPVTVPDKGSLNVAGISNTTANHVFTNIENTFTVEFWANPQTEEDFYYNEATDPYAGTRGHNYAIYPYWGGLAANQAAGMGVSVGTNGLAVFEHADYYMPAKLIWQGSISGWTHIAIVYDNGTPSLYINGQYMTTGTVSAKQHVYPSYNFDGGSSYGYYTGGLDEMRIWKTARSAAQIYASYNKIIAPDDAKAADLAGYWPMDAGGGGSASDVTCNNNAVPLAAAAESWSSDVPPITETDYIEFADRFIVPNHGLPTNYVYNSLNQVIKQTTPDAGVSQFWYDRLGRSTASQNAEQSNPVVAGDPVDRYSYTRYDDLGRISEVGEKINVPAGSPVMSEDLARMPGDPLNPQPGTLNHWLTLGNNRQVTVTAYDTKPTWAPSAILQTNLRKRVAATALLSLVSNPARPTDASQNRLAASYYDYDITGNVGTLVQENRALINNETQLMHGTDGLTGYKTIKYDYDLISGKVNSIMYQPGKWDQFSYQYIYDGDNRLLQTYTSREYTRGDVISNNFWKREVNYTYYPHGQLARMELGPNNAQVQGLDYAYTLQGWLKGVNGNFLDATKDMGQDGANVSGNQFINFGRDVIAYSLGYYAGDYTPIGTNLSNPANAFDLRYDPSGASSGVDLFNGNISTATYSIAKLENGNPVGYSYRYDQLNRLKAMNRHNLTAGSTGWDKSSIIADYGEQVTYDANGNIKTYLRNGTSATLPNGGGGLSMDNLSYGYNLDSYGQLVNNKLRHVKDAATTSTYTADIKDQADDNYSYDNIGNLVGDLSEGNSVNKMQIKWTVYGKIESITKPRATTGVNSIVYGYDVTGNRITKTVTDISTSPATVTTTHYVRDATGNVLGVYGYKFAGVSTQPSEGSWLEQHIYGSSRLGIVNPNIKILSGAGLGNDDYPSNSGIGPTYGISGLRSYELTNHLGNVLATITDNQIQVPSQGYNNAEVVGAQDYYPFGMLMPGRTWDNGGKYRYGFNGKENDREVKGDGNELNFGTRIYDPRIGRFLSVDPLQVKFPDLSPYIYAENGPLSKIDQEGKYALFIHFMLTRYMLMKAGVSEVQANLLSHYASVFADNPGGIKNFSEYKAYSKADMIIYSNIKSSQEDNPIFAQIGGRISEETVFNGVTYDFGIDYSRTVKSQSEDPEAQKWHATRTYAERNYVSSQEAVNRSFSNAWTLLFKSASESSLENMKKNTSAIEDFGLAIHTFEDIQAHAGAVFRATALNVFGYFSTNGNQHNISNDGNPNPKRFAVAQFYVGNAILIHQIMSGSLRKFKVGTQVATFGMSDDQIKKLTEKINAAGYSLKRNDPGNKGNDLYTITKKK